MHALSARCYSPLRRASAVNLGKAQLSVDARLLASGGALPNERQIFAVCMVSLPKLQPDRAGESTQSTAVNNKRKLVCLYGK